MKAGRRVVVANNVISDITGGYGLHIWGDFDDSWVINNTVYGAAASGFIIGGNSDRGYPDRVVTANNILAGQSGTADGQQGYAAKEYQPGRGNSTRHNLGWANSRSAPWALTAAGPSDNRTADPRFANAGTRDLHPRGGSPRSTRPRASACCSTPTACVAPTRPTRARTKSADTIRGDAACAGSTPGVA